MATNVEIWKPIPGYLNYKVSNWGRVKSIPRLDTCGNRRKGKMLAQTLNHSGYPMVTIYENGKRMTYTVHKLVTAAFIGERPENMEVNHIDENKTNNHIDNLEYVTKLQNIRHGTAIARHAQKQINHPAKSSPVIQYSIAGDFIARFPSQHEAMRQTGISNKNISQVCTGEKHSAGGYKWGYA